MERRAPEKDWRLRRTLSWVPMVSPLAVLLSVAIASGACAQAAPRESQSNPLQNMDSLKAKIRRQFPSVSQLSTEELAAWLEAETTKIVLLDVRKPDEYAVSHLPGALLAEDKGSALRALEEVPKDSVVVLYCSVGYRSSALAETLQELGYKQVFNLEGSIFQWANEGRPLLRDGDPVRQVHPFNSRWGRYLNRELWKPVEP